MKFVITSAYGALDAVRGGRVHTGIDLAMPMDTPLRSFCDGVVESVTNYGANDIGKGVIIRAKDGVRYIYGHLDDVKVRVGEHVTSGTLIGLSGNSGHSTGPHLHFAETVNGQYVDPSNVVDKVANMAGQSNTSFWSDPMGSIRGAVQDSVQNAMEETVLKGLEAVGDVLLHLAYGITLVGSGILLLLKLVGFEHRWLKPSVLMVAYVIIRYVFGGA